MQCFSSTYNIASASVFYKSHPQKNICKTIRILHVWKSTGLQIRKSAFTGGRAVGRSALCVSQHDRTTHGRRSHDRTKCGRLVCAVVRSTFSITRSRCHFGWNFAEVVYDWWRHEIPRLLLSSDTDTGIMVFLETVYYRRAFLNTAHPSLYASPETRFALSFLRESRSC